MSATYALTITSGNKRISFADLDISESRAVINLSPQLLSKVVSAETIVVNSTSESTTESTDKIVMDDTAITSITISAGELDYSNITIPADESVTISNITDESIQAANACENDIIANLLISMNKTSAPAWSQNEPRSTCNDYIRVEICCNPAAKDSVFYINKRLLSIVVAYLVRANPINRDLHSLCYSDVLDTVAGMRNDAIRASYIKIGDVYVRLPYLNEYARLNKYNQ